MINKKVIIGMLLVIVCTFIGCSAALEDKKLDENMGTNQQATEIPNLPPKIIEIPKQEIDPIEEQIQNMTVEEQIGQIVIVGLDGYKIDEPVKIMIENYHIGGFILFGKNVESVEQLLALVNALKKENAKNKVPLFISVDEEGGRVSRMPNEIVKLPTNRTIGKVNNSDFSYQIGTVLAEQIKAFGFNMNFAPVLDIHSNPKNPVIGDRSFGSDRETVSTLGIQTMKGIQAGGVISVVKHFPGHGDTEVDSHVGLPLIDHDMDRLNSFELVPFVEAVKNQADAVMIAHILLPKIDSVNPASMSKTIITDLLRKQLGFTGVIMTDDLTMGAIVQNYTIGDAAVKSVNAGSDIILVCHGYDDQRIVLDALKKAVEEGIISKERVHQSIYRILKLKQKYHLEYSINHAIDIKKINTKINSVLDKYIQ